MPEVDCQPIISNYPVHIISLFISTPFKKMKSLKLSKKLPFFSEKLFLLTLK